MLWLLAALIAPASADSFDLANGSTLEGTLATYELGGNCQIFVSAGPVRGATLLLPCSEILAMRRPGVQPAAAPAAPAAPGLEVEALVAPAAVVVPAQTAPQAVQMAPEAAQLPDETPSILVIEEPEPEPEAAPAPPAPVAASLPEGYALPVAAPAADAVAVAEPVEAGPTASNLRSEPRPTPEIGEPSAAPAAPAAPPSGWNQKSEGVQLPKWLQKALYGDEAPPAGQADDT